MAALFSFVKYIVDGLHWLALYLVSGQTFAILVGVGQRNEK